MITIPIYDLLVLPGITFFFKKDMFPREKITPESVGEEVLFVMLKNEASGEEIMPEDLYPVGVTGKIESIDEEGSVKISTEKRVTISGFQSSPDGLVADTQDNPEEEDIPAEEEKERFEKTKKEMMDFAKGFQWGIWARSMIYHWKSFDEAACALAGYMNITWEEKYAILSTNSRRQRCDILEQAFYELMEIFRVSEEAESAQKNSNEKIYRESALKKQI